MTGVFHFMAISFACVFAPVNLCQRRTPVNSKRARSSVKVVALSLLIIFGLLGRPSSGIAEAESTQPRFAVLVFSKTTGFRHDSIPHGIVAIKTLGAHHGFSVDSTEDATPLHRRGTCSIPGGRVSEHHRRHPRRRPEGCL